MPTFAAIDVEIANPRLASICQIGVTEFKGGELVDQWVTLVNPEDYFDPINVAIHGIDESMVAEAPVFRDAVSSLVPRLEGKVVTAHTSFDRSALLRAFEACGGTPFVCKWLDSSRVARLTWPTVASKGYGLANLAAMLGIEFRHHDALEDSRVAGLILLRALQESGQSLDWWLDRVHQRSSPSSVGGAPIAQLGNPLGPFSGEVIAFTGQLSMTRADAAKAAASVGCEVGESVNRKTTILVVGDQDITRLAGKTKSSKHLKAEQLVSKGMGIRIVGESDFLSMLGPISLPE
ncbi:exonuclease domain-containing protein [Bordetella sp. 15P40C-2]|uniref:exonuclease domain-containing protein n=1 Tax=Bordetella sp. 15P40C-2 TaxID=2572246 RepID=UPI001325A4EC|nr:exonuclease domain-containing protein [Bordetella sp. 15P40C-2]MVW72161.1 transposase [Bordetella sp. 15P40C-2]